MPTFARVGVDTAGGLITGGGQSKFRVQGQLVAVVGDSVAGHGLGAHAAPSMAAGSSKFFIQGKAACRAGDAATCGHAATGSGKGSAG